MNNLNNKRFVTADATGEDFRITLSLNDDELAAVEAWRTSNNIPSVTDAVRELVRLGLLSEISKVHGVVSAIRESVER